MRAGLALAAGYLRAHAPGPPLESVGASQWGSFGLPYVQRLDNLENVQYTAEMEVGGQPIRGLYDTGSFELLVVSTRCQVCTVTHYDPTRSVTYHAQSDELVLHSFGSGPTHSRLGLEHVSIGPLSAWNVSFFEVVDHQIPPLDGGTIDAIVGIAPGSDKEVSLVTQFNITQYSICLERGSLSPGWLTWGDAEIQDIAGIRLKVVGDHHWAVSLTAFRPVVEHTPETKDAANLLLCGNGCAAVLDSGTSLIAAPSVALQGLQFLLPPLQEDCSNFNDLPVLEIEMDGHLFELPPEAYVLRLKGAFVEAKSVWDVLYFKPKLSVIDQCFYAFMPLDAATEFGPLWVLGMPFFRFFHTTYEFAPGVGGTNRTVLLHKAGEDCKPEDLVSAEAVNPDGQTNYPFPDMVVTQAGANHSTTASSASKPSLAHAKSTVRKAGRQAEPLTVAAAGLRLPDATRWLDAKSSVKL